MNLIKREESSHAECSGAVLNRGIDGPVLRGAIMRPVEVVWSHLAVWERGGNISANNPWRTPRGNAGRRS